MTKVIIGILLVAVALFLGPSFIGLALAIGGFVIFNHSITSIILIALNRLISTIQTYNKNRLISIYL